MPRPRTRCPRCGRSTAVIGNAGQLARHTCAEPAHALTPQQRLVLVRDAERRLRERLVTTNAQLASAERALPRCRVLAWAAIGALPAAVVLTANQGLDAGHALLLTVAIVSTIAARGNRTECRNVIARNRNCRLELVDQHSRAHAELVAVEAELPPDPVWPEIHPAPLEDIAQAPGGDGQASGPRSVASSGRRPVTKSTTIATIPIISHTKPSVWAATCALITTNGRIANPITATARWRQ